MSFTADATELGRRFMLILTYLVIGRDPQEGDNDYQAGWYDAINEFGSILMADPEVMLRVLAESDDEAAKQLINVHGRGDFIVKIIMGANFTDPHPITIKRLADVLGVNLDCADCPGPCEEEEDGSEHQD